MSRHCPSRRSPTSAVGPVTTTFVDTLDDALFVVAASSAGTSPPFGTMALLLEEDDRLITVVECRGCDRPIHVVELCSVLLAAATPAGAWRRCVLVSDSVADHDADTVAPAWADLRAAFCAAGVDLVDWLLLAAGVPLEPFGVRSVRADVDGAWVWE